MEKDWKLDLIELKKALKSKKTNPTEKKQIRELINLNNGKKNMKSRENVSIIKDFEIAKKKFLNKMKLDYYTYGENFINTILDLAKLNIFVTNNDSVDCINDMDVIADIILELYSKYSNKLYQIAKNQIQDKNILIVEDISKPSYMVYLNCLNKAICVVDKCENTSTLIHEMQHSIEAILDLTEPKLFLELGSITFETLFIDELVNLKVLNSELLYFDRIQYDYDYLMDLEDYFNAILIAKKKNFNLTNVEFSTLLTDVMRIDENCIMNYICEELSFNDLEERLIYLTSHMKSMQIRDMMLNDKKLGLKELKKCLTKDEIDFNSENNIHHVREFIKEINRKK